MDKILRLSISSCSHTLTHTHIRMKQNKNPRTYTNKACHLAHHYPKSDFVERAHVRGRACLKATQTTTCNFVHIRMYNNHYIPVCFFFLYLSTYICPALYTNTHNVAHNFVIIFLNLLIFACAVTFIYIKIHVHPIHIETKKSHTQMKNRSLLHHIIFIHIIFRSSETNKKTRLKLKTKFIYLSCYNQNKYSNFISFSLDK